MDPLGVDMKTLEAFHMRCQRQILDIRLDMGVAEFKSARRWKKKISLAAAQKFK